MKNFAIFALGFALVLGGSACTETVYIKETRTVTAPPRSSGGSSSNSNSNSYNTRGYGISSAGGSSNSAGGFEPVGKPQ